MTALAPDLSAELELAVAASREAGKLMLQERMNLKPSDIEEKGPNDFVTRVDKALEHLITQKIRSAFPQDRVLGEEGGGALHGGRLWVIDPLDGTTNYIHRFPFVTVAIALAVDGVIQAGVIHDPVHGEVFSALRGRGTLLNGRSTAVSGVSDIGRAFVGTGFPSRYKRHMEPYLKQFAAAAPVVGSIRRAGSACLDLAYVACGRFDAFWDSCLSPWDMAAGTLLVESAGGVVTDEFGNAWTLESHGVIAGNPKIQPELLKLVKP